MTYDELWDDHIFQEEHEFERGLLLLLLLLLLLSLPLLLSSLLSFTVQ